MLSEGQKKGLIFFECEKRPLGSLCLFPPWRMNGLRVHGRGYPTRVCTLFSQSILRVLLKKMVQKLSITMVTGLSLPHTGRRISLS